MLEASRTINYWPLVQCLTAAPVRWLCSGIELASLSSKRAVDQMYVTVSAVDHGHDTGDGRGQFSCRRYCCEFPLPAGSVGSMVTAITSRKILTAKHVVSDREPGNAVFAIH